MISANIWLDMLVFSNKDETLKVCLLHLFCTAGLAGDVKQATHFSQRVGNVACRQALFPKIPKLGAKFPFKQLLTAVILGKTLPRCFKAH